LLSNLVALASLGLPQRWRPELFVALVVGLAVGMVSARRVPDGAARSATLAVAAAGGAVAAARALV
jgi:small basic protein